METAISLRMQRILKSIAANVKRISYNGLKAGKTPVEIQEEIGLFLSKNGLVARMRPQLMLFARAAVQQGIQDAKTQYNYIRSHTRPIDLPSTRIILQDTITQVVKIESKLNTGILKHLAEGIVKQRPSEKIINNIVKELGGKTAMATNIVRTGMAGFSGAVTIGIAEEAGIDEFTYYGAKAEREFCIRLLKEAREGKTWTIDEIKRMNNKQGLDVLHYCGGYRCVHRWRGVVKKKNIVV